MTPVYFSIRGGGAATEILGVRPVVVFPIVRRGAREPPIETGPKFSSCCRCAPRATC